MTRFVLNPGMFTDRERALLRGKGVEASAFRYPSGVEALRVQTDRVSLVWLPFHGQQIWRFVVDGEDVTMRTTFDEPLDVPKFAMSYGPFLMHCGLSAMGNPGPDDNHPPHGELPLARYRSAWVEVSDEAGGTLLGLGGELVYRVTHALHYAFSPNIAVRPGSTVLEVTAEITNRRSTDLIYQYLCHVNWAFTPAELLQSAPMTGAGFVLYPDAGADAQTQRYTDAIARDATTSNRLTSADHIVPEYCALSRPLAGDDGWADYLMLRPDGRAAWVGFDTATLPYAIRWISRTTDEEAVGFALPSTGHHLGHARSAADGMLRRIATNDHATMRIRAGLLDASKTAEVRARIARTLQGR